MSDENTVIDSVVESTPEQITTAESVPEVSLPDEKTTTAESKTFTQEELDAIVGKRLAREQRKWEREQQAARLQESRQVQQVPLEVDQFANYDDYVEALAEQKAEQKLIQREQVKRQQQLVESYSAREEFARDKYDDFEQVAYNVSLPVTDIMAEVIQESEIGPEILYHLGNNPKEALRISRLPPALQAKELGKVEVALSNAPPAKKTSNAPEPITPVRARSAGTPAYDTTDPRSAKDMSTAEWIAAENARERRKLESRNN